MRIWNSLFYCEADDGLENHFSGDAGGRYDQRRMQSQETCYVYVWDSGRGRTAVTLFLLCLFLIYRNIKSIRKII